MGKLRTLLTQVEQKSQKLEQTTTQLQGVNQKLLITTDPNKLQHITAEYEQLTRVMQLIEHDLISLEKELKAEIEVAEDTLEHERQAHKDFVNLLAEVEMNHLHEHEELKKMDDLNHELVNLLAESELEHLHEDHEIHQLVQEHKTLVNLVAETQLEQNFS
ncbi:MAG: hypothetical protein ACRCWD_06370 [Culicoidibacterales bacterium]